MIREGKRQADIQQQKWEEERRRYEQERAEQKRQEAIKESRKDLFEIIDAWGLAKRMEGFFGGIDALARFQAWTSP